MQRNGKLRYGYNFMETHLGAMYSYECDIQLLEIELKISHQNIAEY